MVELMLRDSAGDSFNAFQQGRELGRQVRSQNALASYDPGNLDATRNALIQAGDLGTAGQLQNQQLNGDYRQQQIEAAKQAQLAKHHAFIEGEATKLQGILAQNGPEAVLQAFDAQMPIYQQMGEDPAALATLRELIKVHPETALAGLAGVRKPDIRQSGRFVRGIDPLTGKEQFSYDLPQDQKPVVMRDANGNTALVDPDTGEVLQRLEAPKQFAPKRSGGGAAATGLPPGYVAR
jgi:hypothetical protein